MPKNELSDNRALNNIATLTWLIDINYALTIEITQLTKKDTDSESLSKDDDIRNNCCERNHGQPYGS